MLPNIWIARGHVLLGFLAGFVAWYAISHQHMLFYFLNCFILLLNFYLAFKAYQRVEHENRPGL